MQKTIFFSVSNAGGTIYKIRAFQKLGYRVIAGDANPNAIGKFTADKFYQIPWQNDPDYSKAILKMNKHEYLMGIQVWTGEEIVIDPKDIDIHKGLTYQGFYESLIYDRAGNVIEG